MAFLDHPPTTSSTMHYSTSPPPLTFSISFAPPPVVRTSSPLSRASSSSPFANSTCNSRNASNHSRRLAHPHAPPTPTSLSTLLSHSPIFPPFAAHSWWTVLEPRPTPTAPHLVIPVVRDHAALVQLVGAWPSEQHAGCPKAMAAWIVDHLSSRQGQDPDIQPSTPVTISQVSVVHQGAEVRIDLLDPRPLLHALCSALDTPPCHEPGPPSHSNVLIDPQAAQEPRGQAIAHFLTRLTSPLPPTGSSSTSRPIPPMDLSPAPAAGTKPVPPALAHAHRILRTPSGSHIIDLGAELGVATLLTSAHAWTPVTTLADHLLTHPGQIEFIVATQANERWAKQAVALVETVLGCAGPKIVAYATASLGLSHTTMLACNRATALPANGAAASAKNDKVWAKVAAVADSDALWVPPVLGSATMEHMDTPTMQLALTLMQYPSVLRRCLVSAESAPLATYAMRVAGLVGKQKGNAASQVSQEVERVAAKVVRHAVAVLGGGNGQQ